jgi:pimeloyl-ACP methyl ester carboxylesterase
MLRPSRTSSGSTASPQWVAKEHHEATVTDAEPGFTDRDQAAITAPLLVVHGGADLMVPGSHGVWLAEHCPTAELWLRAEDGHISILTSAGAALEWLQSRAS